MGVEYCGFRVYFLSVITILELRDGSSFWSSGRDPAQGLDSPGVAGRPCFLGRVFAAHSLPVDVRGSRKNAARNCRSRIRARTAMRLIAATAVGARNDSRYPQCRAHFEPDRRQHFEPLGSDERREFPVIPPCIPELPPVRPQNAKFERECPPHTLPFPCAACKAQPSDAVPRVGSLRQAGRYMPEYPRRPAKKSHSHHRNSAKTPELAICAWMSFESGGGLCRIVATGPY